MGKDKRKNNGHDEEESDNESLSSSTGSTSTMGDRHEHAAKHATEIIRLLIQSGIDVKGSVDTEGRVSFSFGNEGKKAQPTKKDERIHQEQIAPGGPSTTEMALLNSLLNTIRGTGQIQQVQAANPFPGGYTEPPHYSSHHPSSSKKRDGEKKMKRILNYTPR